MAPIAPDIVSYEHSAPLQYPDIDEIREKCRRGFDRQADDFMWTVPDLRVIVRDDLGVACGLNRMANRNPDGSEDVTWSRGTRIFQRRVGSRRMIHQHVSFPIDAQAGAAATGAEAVNQDDPDRDVRTIIERWVMITSEASTTAP